MKVHEYQAKALMSQYGVRVPLGMVATTPEQAREHTRTLGGQAVLKAQVHAGGRGKAGGIRLVKTPQEAEQVARDLLGRRLVTHQTGPEGVPVHALLVEEPTQPVRELYFALTVDGSAGGVVAIASAEGGVEIEEVARERPQAIHRVVVDPVVGLQAYQARRLAYRMGLEEALVRPFAEMVRNLYRLMVEKDASLVEVNPLVVTADGRLVALDAKINFDDDAIFRHPDIWEMRDPSQEDPLEARARDHGIAYVRLNGDVGCLVNGAGLAMATMDIVKSAGAEPANFLDVGGGAPLERVKEAFTIILEDPRVRRVFVNIFGGILRCDIAAEGIVQACREKGRRDLPIVVRMLGTNVEEGRRILSQSGLPVHFTETLKEATARLQELAQG